MEIRQQSLQKYLHDIAIDQLSEDYINKGYQIVKDEKIGKYLPDLVAKNGDETIIFEVKTGRMTKERKEAIAEIGDYVRKRNNYKFLVVFAAPPRKKNLDIENIEELLTTIFNENYPGELQGLPAVHTQFNKVVNADIDEIKIESKNIFVKGNGVVSINIDYDLHDFEELANEYHADEKFPFSFDVILGYDENQNLEVLDVNELKVDVASFFD